MICPHCKANLTQRNGSGEPLLRNRGLVIKSTGLALVCPKCSGDVPFSPDAMSAVHQVAVLFLQKGGAGKKS